ncbi:UbiA family prenyltransferase [Nocardia sp. NBC_00511]|uniref:UbiA family prenyltransferase n=1 Tax=Nocardia sp. NBC_00511 TaxID=2903591 RepID=UPI0030E1170E
MSKVAVFQHYFGWALAWLLLDPSTAGRSATVSAMCAFLVGSFGIVAATCALDDIVGFRNGSDAVNYLQGDTRRDIRRKPLLSGAVTEKQAIIFVGCAAALAVLAGAYAFWQLDWRAPLLAVVLYAAGLVLSMQYSAGLRVSYHRGGGETLLFIATACGLYAPFLAVSGHWTAPAVTEGVLLGLWMVMVSSYSNVNDAEGDRGVGRRTLAATSGPTLITAVLGSLVVAALGTTVWLVIGGGFPWWTLITLGPAALLHIAQVYTGPVRKDWLGARRLGMYAYNLGFLGIGIPTLYRFVTALPPTIPSPAISR